MPIAPTASHLVCSDPVAPVISAVPSAWDALCVTGLTPSGCAPIGSSLALHFSQSTSDNPHYGTLTGRLCSRQAVSSTWLACVHSIHHWTQYLATHSKPLRNTF